MLYDAVAIIAGPEGAERLVKESAARDFVADAFAHCKFIAHVEAAQPLLDKAGIEPDEGVMALGSAASIADFVESCRKLRLRAREPKVKPQAFASQGLVHGSLGETRLHVCVDIDGGGELMG